jgi:hypothetical protein
VKATILAACDSPELFGSTFVPWPRQREVLEVIEAARLSVLCLGRRSGKTTMAAVTALHSCLLSPHLDQFVQPGETRWAVAIATNRRQARLIVSQARVIVEHSPLLSPLIVSSTEDELHFANGTALAAFPCSSRGGRGWPIHCLIFDEGAHFVSETDGFQTAERVWEALVPSTAQFGDAARVIVCSTPYGSDGFFADMLEYAEGSDEAGYVQFTTAEMNPTISQDFLDKERDRDPESFRSEYGAELVGSGSQYLDPERLEAAVIGPGMPCSIEMATEWWAGLDPAFSSDPFGLVIVGRDAKRPEKIIVGQVRAWKPERRESFDERRLVEDQILAEVAAECRRFGASAVTDQYASHAVVERLQRLGVNVESVPMTATTKTSAYGELRSLIYTSALELPDHPQLIAELRRLRSRYTAGSASVVNPRVGGSHGDLAQALAIAVYDRAQSGGAAFATPTRPPSGNALPRVDEHEGDVDRGGIYHDYQDSPIDSWGSSFGSDW